MDTQIINNDKNAKKNGKSENLKKGAAVAGATLAGAAVVYGANELLNNGEEAELDVPTLDIDPNTIPDQEQATATPTAEQHTAHVEPNVTPGPAPQENNIGNATGEVNPENTDSNPGEQDSGEAISEEEINNIAQEITGEDYIDPTDIDAPNLDIASIGTLTTADGIELAAAQIISDAGDELYVVDVDNDNVYDIVADANGNTIGNMGSLTVGDAEVIMTENAGDTGFLADNNNDGTTDDLLSGIENDIMDINA